MDIPRLHPDTIKDVEDRVDILDVVGERVVLKKRGKDYLGLCPFHEEKTPSFSVSSTKQLYYCFGCGAGGGAIKFLMDFGKQSFTDVVLDLADRYQVSIKTLAPEQRQALQEQLSRREQLYEILAVAAGFYQHALRQPEGETALAYVRETRQLTEEAIQGFGLGYAPGGWEALYRYLVEAKRYPVLLLEAAGLVRPRKQGEGYYDYFRDRLMIPILDPQGRTIAFGSRTLGSDEPKYLNSPETELFNKGETLYGLDRAKGAIAKADQAVIVEGYFDVIALHAAGITQGVAALGTALGERQIKQLCRYTESKQIILNFDADGAGIKATSRAIREVENLIYTGQIQLRILNLPGGKDADEFLRSSPDAVAQYQKQLATAPLWLDWQIEQLLIGVDLAQADQFDRVSKGMLTLLKQIVNHHTRKYYLDACAKILAQGNQTLSDHYRYSLLRQLHRRKPKELKRQENVNPLEPAEKLLLIIYIHYPQQRQMIKAAIDQRDLMFSLSHYRFLWQQILTQEMEGAGDLLQQLRVIALQFPTEFAFLTPLLHLNEIKQWDLNPSDRVGLLVKAAITRLERVSYQKSRAYCLQQSQSLDRKAEPEKYAYYLNEFYRHDQKVRELDQQCSVSLLDVIQPELQQWSE